MAFEYFLYDTNFNNTLVDRSANSFAPLPPNTGEIYIDFNIPEIQPLHLYRESGGTIVYSDETSINEYLDATVIITGEDAVLQNEFTGYTAATEIKLFNIEDNYLPESGGTIYGDLIFDTEKFTGTTGTSQTHYGSITHGTKGGLKIGANVGMNLDAPAFLMPQASGNTGAFLTIGQDGLLVFTSLNTGGTTGDTITYDNINSGTTIINKNVLIDLNVPIILPTDVNRGYASWTVKYDNTSNQEASVDLIFYKDTIESFRQTYKIPRQTNETLYGSISIANSIPSGTTIELKLESDKDGSVNYTLLRTVNLTDGFGNAPTKWGEIVGNLSDQTDLSLKLDTLTAATDQKIDKVTGAVGNLGTFNIDGNLDDTGIVLSAITGVSTQSAIQIRIGADYAITTTPTDVPFDVTDVQNDVDTLEHNVTNIERIDVKRDGLYFIYFDGQTTNTTVTTQVNLEIYKNGTTLISGGASVTNTYQNETHKLTDGVIANLVAGDYITSRLVRNQTDSTLLAPASLMIFSMKGIQGQKGDIGSGSVTLQNNDVNVSNTPHDTINFDSGFTVTDNTGGKATVSLVPVVVNPLDGLCELIDSVGGQEITNITPVPMTWGAQEFIDTTTYTHTIGGSSITILKTGYYEVSFNVNSDNQTNNRSTTGVQVRKNGVAVNKTLTANYTRNNANDDNHNSLPPTTIQFNVNDTLDIILFRLGDANSTLTKANASFVRIKYLG